MHNAYHNPHTTASGFSHNKAKAFDLVASLWSFLGYLEVSFYQSFQHTELLLSKSVFFLLSFCFSYQAFKSFFHFNMHSSPVKVFQPNSLLCTTTTHIRKQLLLRKSQKNVSLSQRVQGVSAKMEKVGGLFYHLDVFHFQCSHAKQYNLFHWSSLPQFTFTLTWLKHIVPELDLARSDTALPWVSHACSLIQLCRSQSQRQNQSQQLSEHPK